MRIAIIHGRFLGTSASEVYARELARGLVTAGHEVTVVSQEPRPERLPFVDEAYELDPDNLEVKESFSRERTGNGTCRHVRPDLGGRLLTHEPTAYEGYVTTTVAETPDDVLQDYLTRTGKAVHTVLQRWPQDFVQVNELVPLPYVTARVLGGRTPYALAVHGADLWRAAMQDPRMVPAAIEGMRYAAAVMVPSAFMRGETVSFARSNGLDVHGKTVMAPPGVDLPEFTPVRGRPGAADTLPELDPADDVVAYVGALRWTKGLQYLLAAMPMIWQRRPGVSLFVAGEGPERAVLEGMARAMDSGDLDLLERLAAAPDLPHGSFAYGPLLPDFSGYVSEQWYRENGLHMLERVHFLGARDRDTVAALMSRADVLVAPSVYPEAAGTVVREAVAAGAVPVGAYHSGLREPLDAVSEELGYDGFKVLVPGMGMTFGLAEVVPAMLERYPTKGPGFRRRLHDLAERAFSPAALSSSYLRAAAGGRRVPV